MVNARADRAGNTACGRWVMVFVCWLAAMAALSGCELAAVNVTPPASSVVVHAVLNPDVDQQVILVESSLTGAIDVNDRLKFNALDPIRTAGGSPITGADVRLLSGTDTVGVRAIETMVSGRGTGRYVVARAALAVLPGRGYRLRIRTTEGTQVTGETRVPSSDASWVAGAGSVARPLVLSRTTDTLRLTWNATPDAATYAVRIESPYGPWFLFSDSTRFALPGTLKNFFASGLPSVWYPGFLQPLSVIAVDRNFYDYNRTGNDPFGGTGLISSVKNGLGLFGSVLPLLRRDVTVIDRDKVPLDARWVGATANTAAQRVDMDLWLEGPGPTISSVSGRVRTNSDRATDRYVVGTVQGESIRLVALVGASRSDTLWSLVGRLAGDSITGTYATRFATDGPKVFRRQARGAPLSSP
ncbi:DUF4249 family protein [Gemmatimonas sp.]|uniref:DUF4249 family protein n=1 Tax=Gemmatimonas sp. TaxID=1962908 RepID=UPI003563C2B2